MRARACDQLITSVVDQGWLTPAAAAVVPFVAEIATSPEVPDRAPAVSILAELARGQVCPAEAFGDTLSPDGYLEDGSGPWAHHLDRLVRQRLGEHMAAYLGLLEADESAVRLQATDLLSELPEYAAESVPALLECLDREADAIVRANAIRVLVRLAGAEHADLLASLADSEEPALSRLVALGGYVAVQGDEASRERLEQLRTVILNPDPELVRHYNSLPSTTQFLYDLAIPLASADPARAPDLLPAMVAAFEGGLSRGLYEAEALLTVALGRGGEQTSPSALSDLQRKAILAVARMGFPDPRFIIGVTSDVLRRHGLPGSRDKLEAFLGEQLHWREARPPRQPRPWWKVW